MLHQKQDEAVRELMGMAVVRVLIIVWVDVGYMMDQVRARDDTQREERQHGPQHWYRAEHTIATTAPVA